MRALVISGGGCKGAFAGGYVKYLVRELGRKYDLIVGTSTGSLLSPFVAMDMFDEAYGVYTTVAQKDIYNICPFRIKLGKDGQILSSINHFNTLRMFLKGKKTFGEHKNLLKTIQKHFTPEHFEKLKSSNKKVVVTVSNLTNHTVEYKHDSDYNYQQFCEWMWASSSFVPFMSLYENNGYEYADGGLGNYIPCEEAVNLGATEIDAIVLQPRHSKIANEKTENAFHLFLRSMEFIHHQMSSHDIMIGHLESIYNNQVKINFHFTPRDLTKHSFYFDPVQMAAWWDEGFEYAKSKFS